MSKPKNIVVLALLTAVSLILFAVELQIPPITPIPHIKIGLANTVTLFILYKKGFGGADAVFVVIARVLLASLVTGSLFSLLFSFSGGIVAVLVMTSLKKLFPPPVTSVAGALAHNLMQVAVAVFIYGGFGVLIYLPALVLGGIIAGLLTGFTMTIILSRL
ncbi:MAG: Gx transporter family protein [Oscillospiraceae bacterium]|nr:Gx transporter family protein [Oscillospiraceae bacterium]